MRASLRWILLAPFLVGSHPRIALLGPLHPEVKAAAETKGHPRGTLVQGKALLSAGHASAAEDPQPLDLGRHRIRPSRFSLKKGEFVRLLVDQREGDLEVLVRGPTGETVLSVDALNGSNGPEDVPLLAGQRGTYRLQAKATGPAEGRHSSEVIVRRRATRRDRDRWEAAWLTWRGRESTTAKEGIQLLTRAASLWASLKDRRGEADTSFQLAQALASQKQHRRARELFLRAGDLYRGLRDRRQLLSSFQNLAEVFRDENDLESCRLTLEKALRIEAGRDGTDVRADLLLGLGMLLIESGEFERSLPPLEEARAIRSALNDRRGLAEALNALGRAYYKSGDFKRALERHWQAMTYLSRNSDPSIVAFTLHHLGDAFSALGDRGRATFRYQWALRIWGRTRQRAEEAMTFNNLARTYFAAGNFAAALGALKRAIAIYDQEGDTANGGQALANAAWLYSSMGQPLLALKALDEARRRSGGRASKPLEGFLHLARARAWFQLRDLDRSIAEAERSLAIVETIRSRIEQPDLRQTFVPGIQKNYEVAIDSLMERHRIDPRAGWDRKALEVSERARARSLLDVLEGRPALPKVAARTIQRDLLDADSVLLEFFLGDEKSYVWVVTRNEFRSFEIAKREDLEALAKQVATGIAESDTLDDLRELHHRALELSRSLLGPLGRLPEQKRLVLVLPPELQSVPFAALPNPFSRHRTDTESIWPNPLILDRAIVSEPSMAVLLSMRQTRRTSVPAGDAIAVFAAPRYSPSNLPGATGARELSCLDGSRRLAVGALGRLNLGFSEVEALKDAAGTRRVRVFLGADASVENVQALDLRPFRYLLFSSHGYVDPEDPNRSAIVLSSFDGRGRPVEPCLFARDIAALRFSADLVMVSACGSGLGRAVRGEGLLGLPQAFLSAGVRRVGVTLWDVQERPTADFMRIFHLRLLRDGMSPADALRDAQIETWRRKRSSSPAFWGGFLLIGDWK